MLLPHSRKACSRHAECHSPNKSEFSFSNEVAVNLSKSGGDVKGASAKITITTVILWHTVVAKRKTL